MIFGIHPGVSIHLSTIIRRATCHFQFSSSGRTPMEKSSTGILPKIRTSSCRLFSVCPWGMSRDTDCRYNSLIPGYSLWPPTKFGYYLPCYRSYCRDGSPIYWWRSIAVRKHWSICNGMKYNISFGNYKYSSVIYMAQNRITPPRLSLYPHRSMSNCYTKISNNTKIWSLK